MASPASDAEPPVEPKRRPWNQVHPKDQQIKQSKKLCIEHNWKCGIHECLPEAIRPRVEIKKGSKARLGDTNTAEEVWWNWSVELLKALDEFSSMTAGDYEYARNLLTVEVEHRNNNPKSPQRKIIELLLGDVQRVTEETRRRLADANTQDTMDGVYGNGANMSLVPTSSFDGNASAIKGHIAYNSPTGSRKDPANSRSPLHRSSPNGLPNLSAERTSDGGPRSPSPTTPSYEIGELPEGMTAADHLKTTHLKAKALRLRAQAVRMEAEAVHLEVQARELQELGEE